MKTRTSRVLHITQEKCGSQWVRDVLSAPEIVAISGHPHSGISLNINACNRLEIPDHTFSGPIYGMNQWEWQYWKRPGDKAVVVLRDPRDLMISLMFSVLYSHVSDDRIDSRRRVLHDIPSDEKRVAYLIPSSIGTRLRMYRTWIDGVHEDALVLRYESLVANQHAEFGKVFDWLGWKIPQEILCAVVDRLSFEARSGRKPGATDKFSHYRRGVPGDWRNYFVRQNGEQWERLYPGFLREIGYEESDDWWRDLPETLAGDTSGEPEGAGKVDPQAAMIEVLQNKQQQLQQGLVDKERVIQQLLVEREAGKLSAGRKSFISRLSERLRGK
ncbi:MAG: hypothetical protein QG662_365 [Pseudomonadota bacterium]|nr:hypothetical protein [Pseudomonadota bacterium]